MQSAGIFRSNRSGFKMCHTLKLLRKEDKANEDKKGKHGRLIRPFDRRVLRIALSFRGLKNATQFLKIADGSN